MGVKFDKTVYLYVQKSKAEFDSEEKILAHAKNNQDFTVGNVTLNEYDTIFKGKGWFGRKIIALPKAAIAGAIKTTYHIALAVIVGSFSAISDDGAYFKAQIFCVIRDLEEAAGWVVGLVYDKLGQFLVQESLFHKSCYEAFYQNDKSEEGSYERSPSSSPTSFKRYSPIKPIHAEKPISPISPISPLSPISPVVNKKPAQKEKPQENPLPPQNLTLTRQLEKEFDAIGNAKYDERKNLYLDHAEKCFNEGCIDVGLKSMKASYTDSDVKEAYFAKAAEAYINRNEADKAVDVISGIYKTELKEKLYEKAAEKQLLNDELTDALSTIKKIYSDTKRKENFIKKIAKAYLDKGDRKEASDTIKCIYSDSDAKEKFLKEIVLSYLKEGLIEEGLNAVSSIYSDSEFKEDVYFKAANIYLTKGNREKAIETIKKIYSKTEVKESFLKQVAESYVKEGKFEKAIDCIGSVYSDTEAKEGMFIKIANAYLVKGDREKALGAIRKVYSKSEVKEKFIEDVAKLYFDEGKLDEALNVINSIYGETEGKLDLIHKIARIYIDRKEADNAFKAIGNKWCTTHERKDLLIELIQLYASQNNPEGVINTIKDFVDFAIKAKLKKTKYFSLYHTTYIDNLSDKNFRAWIKQAAKESYNCLKGSFDKQSIVDAVNKCCTDEFIEGFLRFNKKYTRNEYSNVKDIPSENHLDKFYSELGLKASASKEDIKKAFKKLTLQYHPDRVVKKENESESDYAKRKTESEEKFKVISEAYQILMDKED